MRNWPWVHCNHLSPFHCWVRLNESVWLGKHGCNKPGQKFVREPNSWHSLWAAEGCFYYALCCRPTHAAENNSRLPGHAMNVLCAVYAALASEAVAPRTQRMADMGPGWMLKEARPRRNGLPRVAFTEFTLTVFMCYGPAVTVWCVRPSAVVKWNYVHLFLRYLILLLHYIL